MNRQTFNAMCAQYSTPEISGDGLVSWDSGKKCVIPSVKLYGAAVQATLEGKNLFDLAGRVQRQLSGAANTTPREFDGHSYYVGLSSNNYYYPTFVADFSIDSRDGAVSVQGGNQSGYGLAFDFPAAPGETYTISFTPSQETIRTSWYDAEGYPINNSGGKSPYIITAPDNAKWLVVLFSPGANTAKTYSNIQLELGPTVTAYEPYCGGIPAPNPSYPIQPVCNNGVFRVADGGQAQAPELWAIPGTEYRDEWDPQTGRGIRRCGIIDSYAGEAINTPYLSSTGALTEGAAVIYGILDAPFTTSPAKLTMPTGYGQIIQTSGDVPNCPISAKYLTHS